MAPRTNELILKDFGITGEGNLQAFLERIDPDYLRDTLELRARFYSLDRSVKRLGMSFDELVDKYNYDGFIDNVPNYLFQLQQLRYLFTPQQLKDISKKVLTISPYIIGGGTAFRINQMNK